MQHPLVHVSSTATRVPSVLKDSESFRKKDSLSFCPDPFKNLSEDELISATMS